VAKQSALSTSDLTAARKRRIRQYNDAYEAWLRHAGPCPSAESLEEDLFLLEEQMDALNGLPAPTWATMTLSCGVCGYAGRWLPRTWMYHLYRECRETAK
jgi:hypothetical protein